MTPTQRTRSGGPLARVLAAAALFAVPMTARAQAAPTAAPGAGLASHANQLRGDEITPDQQQAVDRGLAWLAAHQAADGSFGGEAVGLHVGITALAGLAFMEAGNLPDRGKYGDNVALALKYVLGASTESGLITAGASQSPMYGHGFATLFLGEIYGMTPDDVVKDKLERSISLIERSQSTQPGSLGGWRYQPVPLDADISVTICQVMALRAARDAGVTVDPGVIDRAIRYVQRCQNADGGFSYMSRASGASQSAFPRSAAGVAALYYAGHFEGEDLAKGLKYLAKFTPTPSAQPGRPDETASGGNYFYGNYYAVQAMFLAGGDYWANWYPGIRDQLLAKQTATGNWSGEYADDYCTAMALIILQMPNRYLPVFNGKGPGD